MYEYIYLSTVNKKARINKHTHNIHSLIFFFSSTIYISDMIEKVKKNHLRSKIRKCISASRNSAIFYATYLHSRGLLSTKSSTELHKNAPITCAPCNILQLFQARWNKIGRIHWVINHTYFERGQGRACEANVFHISIISKPFVLSGNRQFLNRTRRQTESPHRAKDAAEMAPVFECW